jgi:hypothetical protein
MKLRRPFAGFGRMARTIAIVFVLLAATRFSVTQVTLDFQPTFARQDILMTPRSAPKWATTAVIVLGVVLPSKPARSSS